jgi:hypothetical protein
MIHDTQPGTDIWQNFLRKTVACLANDDVEGVAIENLRYYYIC